ncbi:MAG: LysM peptidoglycan-binding domain-containing protein [Solirubrobacterales bacterium]
MADAMKQLVFAEAQTTRGGTPSKSPGASSKRRAPASRRPSGGGANHPRRPRNAKAGAGARLLAPAAILVFAIAMFAVLTADDPTQPQPAATQSGSESSSRSTQSGSDDGDSSTTTTRRSSYTVKPGDSFAAIAEKLNLDVNVLSELNPDVDPRALQPGQKLKLK